MSDPIDGIRYIHKAIRSELEQIEQLACAYYEAANGQLASLSERIRFLSAVVRGHAEGEDAVLYPALEEKFPQICRSYRLEHQAEEHAFARLAALPRELEHASDGTARRELAYRLNREAIALNAVLSLHILKEEEHLVPIVRSHFGAAEQDALVGKSIAHMPGEMMPQIVPWMFRALDPDEREDQMQKMKQAMPPEAFRVMTQWAKAGLPEDDWADITRSMPELS